MIQSRFNYKPSEGKTFSHEGDKTVQNDTLSIREILVRFSCGQPLPPCSMQPEYPERESDIDDPIAEVDWDDPISVREYKTVLEERCQNFSDKLNKYQTMLNELKLNENGKSESGTEE